MFIVWINVSIIDQIVHRIDADAIRLTIFLISKGNSLLPSTPIQPSQYKIKQEKISSLDICNCTKIDFTLNIITKLQKEIDVLFI